MCENVSTQGYISVHVNICLNVNRPTGFVCVPVCIWCMCILYYVCVCVSTCIMCRESQYV